MITKIIDAKCPYCKTTFETSAFGSDWAKTFWGEYASNETDHKCPQCGNTSIVKLTRTYRYTAKKKKG